MTDTNRLRAVLDICDDIERSNPTPEVALVVRRIHHAALGDDPARHRPGRPATELPEWAVSQLEDRGIDPSEVTHFFTAHDGRTIAAAVDGKPVALTR
ncbi:MAG: hypothetical protein HOW97_09715 [Catenulispora sp.]|nr:hypothetical protein [Catenulispora sp.]